jgi:hypothetical protein
MFVEMRRLVGAICLAILVGSFVSTDARAALINYGDSPLIAPGVTFLGVTESSGTDALPLYGTPD